jgi:hypothetical protein
VEWDICLFIIYLSIYPFILFFSFDKFCPITCPNPCLKPFLPKETTTNLIQKQSSPNSFSLIQVRIVSSFPWNYFSLHWVFPLSSTPHAKMVVEYLEMEILSFWILKKEELCFHFKKSGLTLHPKSSLMCALKMFLSKRLLQSHLHIVCCDHSRLR